MSAEAPPLRAAISRRPEGRPSHPGRLWQGWRWWYRCQALEQTLDKLSDRLARTEIALLREEQASQRAQLQLAEAERALVRVQSTLDALRASQADTLRAGRH